MNTMKRLSTFLATFLLFSLSAKAQIRITGTVVTDTAAPIAGATITLHSAIETATVIRMVSDASGLFATELRRAGDYLIDAEAKGFFKLAGRPVFIGPQTSDLNLVLSPVEEVVGSVTVNARPSPVAIEQNGSENTLSGADIVNVPYPGAESLKNGMRVLPGVIQDSFTGIHVNGAPEHEVLYLLDGFNIGDPLSGGFDPRVSVEAVRSLSVLSGAYSSEYGKGGGGVVDLVTNAGDNHPRFSATNFLPGIVDQKGFRIQDWSPRIIVSAPIVKERAWFSNSFIPEYSQAVVQNLPSGQDTSTSTRFSDYFHSQINVDPTDILYAGVLATVATTNRSGLDALDPPSTTVDSHAHQWFAHFREQHHFGRGLVLELGYASNRTHLRQKPQGSDAYVVSPSGRSGNNYLDSIQASSRDQFISNLSAPSFKLAGRHQLKAGIDLDRVFYDQNVRRGELIFLDALHDPIRTIHFIGSGQLQQTNYEVAAYVHDVWRVRENLSVQMGVRADWDRLIRDWTASPRLSAAWSPFGSASTKIAAGYAVTHDATRLEQFAAAADQIPLSTVFPPYGGGQGAYPSKFLIPAHLSSPRYQTWSLTLDQKLLANVFVKLQSLRRRSDNGLAYFGTPQLDAPSVYTLANKRTESYDSAGISLQQNFGKEYGWSASYTRSYARSNTNLEVNPDNYFTAAENAGPLGWDVPDRVLAWAYLPTFRKKWALATLFDFHTGFPFSVANNAGTIIGPVNSYRYPRYLEWNVHVERRFEIRRRALAVRIGFDNITDHFNPDSVNGAVESDQFLHFYGGQPRALALRIRWLGKL